MEKLLLNFELKTRRNTMFEALGNNFDKDNTSWSTPEGGLYTWLKVNPEINLKEIQTGWADVDKLIPLLKFWIEEGRGAKGLYLKGHSHGPANKRNPISDEDFETII